MVGGLDGWLVNWLVGGWISRQVGWSGRQAGRSGSGQVDWLASGWVDGLVADWCAGWMDGLVADWSAGLGWVRAGSAGLSG